ncbi:MAG TPA: cation diffusion facilitator family transporter [Candidatus Binatia bacterium]|jgi:cation diffusion facilitator family transporter
MRTNVTLVVYVALAGNIAVAVTKTAAAVWTGSAALASEAVHSAVDTLNEALLAWGMRRAAQPPDNEHPLGHGRELYFWSFVVALMVFGLGAGFSLVEGIDHIRHPRPIDHVTAGYVVLALAFVFESTSWTIALRHFVETKGDAGFYEAVRGSKDPPGFIVLLEDTAAIAGIVIAAAGTFAASHFGLPVLDGAASVGIALLLAGTALVLLRESASLLIGERADAELARSILAIAAGESGVQGANGVFTVHLAPQQVVAALSLEFSDELTAPRIEETVIAVEKKVRGTHPQVIALFVKPQTAATYRSTRKEGYGDGATHQPLSA